MRSRHIGVAAAAVLMAATARGALFDPPRLVILADGAGPLVLDISTPATPTVLADLQATLPADLSFSAPAFLCWGDDGRLYHTAVLDIAGTPHDSVWEYDAAGYVAHYVLPDPYYGIEGFAVASNGDFIVGDRDKPRSDPNIAPPYLRQYQRSDPTQYIEYSYPDPNNQGDDGIMRLGSTLYVAGNHYVAFYDMTITPPTEPPLDAGGLVQTTEDNQRVAAAPDGRFAVESQWDNFSDPAYRATVEVFGVQQQVLTTLEMPQYWTASEVAFDAAGNLFVLSHHVAASGTDWVTDDNVVRVYGPDLAPLYDVPLPLASYGVVERITVPIPEPASLSLLALGGLVLRRRRS